MGRFTSFDGLKSNNAIQPLQKIKYYNFESNI